MTMRLGCNLNGGTYNYLGNVPAYYKIEDTWKNRAIMLNYLSLHMEILISHHLVG